MKKLLVGAAMVIGMLYVGIAPAAAHQYETSGSIGVLLHVVPNDKPVSGSPTKLIFTFNDSANQFSLQDCNCSVVATHNDKQFMSQKLAVGTGLKTEVPITFPDTGTGYLITLKGEPKNGATFSSFTFEYDDVDVAQGPHVWTAMQKVGIAAGVVALVAVLIGVFLWLRNLDSADTEK